jgi:hypothetical protein
MPRWTWGKAETFLGTAMAIAWFASSVVFGLFSHRLWIRFAIAAALLLIPSLLWLAILYLVRLLVAERRRLSEYDWRCSEREDLLGQLQKGDSELANLRRQNAALMQRLYAERRFEIDRVFLSGGIVHLAFRKKRGRRLDAGRTMCVIDMTDQKTLGFFIVSEERTDEYYASGVRELDPLWLGLMMQSKQLEFSAPPGAAAFLIDEDEDGNTG